jgi:hypothetical protein
MVACFPVVRVSASTTQSERSGAPPAARQAAAGKGRLKGGGKRAPSGATQDRGERGTAVPQGAKRPFEAGNSSRQRPTEVKGSRGAGAEAQPRTGRCQAGNHPPTSRASTTASVWATIPCHEAIRAGRSPHGGGAIRAAGVCGPAASPPVSPPGQRDCASGLPSSRLALPGCASAPHRP